MEVPKGFVQKLWSFISFLPFFFLLFLLGILKAIVVGPIVSCILFFGTAAVIVATWPAHLVWTYYCVIKTPQFGLVLKILLVMTLPLPLILWPIFSIVGSLLVGVGYGFLAPLIATFEVVGRDADRMMYHFFTDGCHDSVVGACTFVGDARDFCCHSYFSYMDDLCEKVPDDQHRMNVKLSKIPSSLLVCLLAIPVDVLAITAVAIMKSPYMLFKGWHRLFHDLIGREGPFLETVCVPFAGLAILLWPLAVVAAVIASFLCSFFLACYAGVIVHQENSFTMGLAYVISIISIFDEYTNDLLYLREGSWFPRPRYRKDQNGRDGSVRTKNESRKGSSERGKAVLHSGKTRTMKKAISQLSPVQVWDWLFKSCEINGKILLSEGVITVADVKECINKGKCKKLSIKLPSWCIMQCLLRSAKSDSYGLLITDEVELTNFNWPKDKFLDWLLGPLLVMKQQIKILALDENEEECLRKLVVTCKNERPEDWDDTGFPSDDPVRIAQIQALVRRLQGIVANMSRIPTFHRRFKSLVKTLYNDASTVADTEANGRENQDNMLQSNVLNAKEDNANEIV